MKILITTGIFPPEIGGPAEYTAKLGATLVLCGHAVKVLAYSDKPSYEFDREYPFTLERIVRTSKLSNYFRFFRATLRNARRADILYSLDWFSAGIPVALAARLLRKKYILRVGGGYIWEKYLNEGNPPLPLRDFYERGLHTTYPFMYRALRFVFRGAERVVFNSEIQKDLYAAHYGLPQEKLAVIFNPVPHVEHGSFLRGEPQKEIIFAGRMIAKNNIENCIRAFAEARLPDFRLTLIGEGFITEKMRALANSLGLKNVSFLPALRQKELYERIKNCRYVILPSWTDVSPNTAYECLALGVPFLLTTENYLSIRDQLPLMIDPRSVADIAEKMRLLAEKDAYESYCKKLRAIEFKNSWDDVCDRHTKIFKCINA